MTSDHLNHWFRKMASSTDYLAMGALHPGTAYAIWARNAYVGIWMPADRGFLISRFKMDATPRLTLELHWDTGKPLGTAKPLRLLECCPMIFTECSAKEISGQEEQALCTWLDALETKHPPYPSAETPAMRRDEAAYWQQRQTEKRQIPPSLRPPLVCQLEEGNTKKSR